MQEIIGTIEGVVGLSVVGIGFVAWLSKLHYDVTKNRQLRQEDKEEILKEVLRMEKDIDKIKASAEMNNKQTMELFMQIKEDLATLRGEIKAFFSK